MIWFCKLYVGGIIVNFSFSDLKCFQSDFSNGYFIGEILHKHGLQVSLSWFEA